MSDVRKWLETIGLAQYGDIFESNDLDIDLLSALIKPTEQSAAMTLATAPLPQARNDAGVFGSKPTEILLSFRDRIEAQRRSLQWHARITSISKAIQPLSECVEPRPYACLPRKGGGLFSEAE
jgi:hypothetical protein